MKIITVKKALDLVGKTEIKNCEDRFEIPYQSLLLADQ
jgi:hypothetical protein